MNTMTRFTKLLIGAALLIGLAALACSPVPAQHPTRSIGGSRIAQAAVEKAQEAARLAAEQASEAGQHATASGDVVNPNGDVYVAEDESVEGDVVAVNGAARVHGKVQGSVIAIGGSVYLPNGSKVGADAISFGGTVTREPKAEVGGSVLQLPGPETTEGGKEPTAAAEPAGETEPADESVRPDRPAPVSGAGPRSEIVQFGQPVDVAADQIVDGDVVSVGGPVRIAGEVRGDVVSLGGPVTISGQVDGNAVTVGGPLSLKDGAEVRGDAVAMGGPIKTSGTASVHGQTVTVGGPLGNLSWLSLGKVLGPGVLAGRGISPIVSMVGSAAAWLGQALAMLILVALVVLVVPRQTETIATVIQEDPRRTLLYGLIGWLLVLPVLVILVLLVVTWILVPIYLLLVAALLIVGSVGVSQCLGKWIVTRLNLRVRSLLGLTLVGFVALALADLLGFLPIVGVVTAIVTIAVLLFAFGGALMTRFGTDPTGAWLSGRTVTAELTIDGPPSEPAAAGQVEDAPMSPPTGEGQGEPPDDEFDETTRRALEELPPEDGSVPPAEPEAPADEEEAG